MKTFSVDAEQAVIGGIILGGEKTYHSVASLLSKDDFFLPKHQIMFSAIEIAIEKKIPVDPLVLMEVLTSQELEEIGGMNAVSEVCEGTPSKANAVAYSAIVLEQSKERKLVNVGRSIIENSVSEESADEKIERSKELLNDLSKKISTDDKDSNQASKEFVLWLKREEAELKSGFFDEHTGGLFAGLIVLAAGTGQGKSTLALNIAYMLRDKHIAYYSLEMPAAQLIGRMVSNHTGLRYQKIRDKELEGHEYTILGNAVSEIRNSNIRFIDNGIHINQLCAHARAMHNNNGLDLVIVDYIQLVGSDGQSREREVANITRKLKGLSMDLDVPVIALSQLSRDHEKRANPRPALRDLRESGAVEQDSDLVIFLYDESKYKDVVDPNNKGLTELYSEKFRHGENFNMNLDQQLHCYRFQKTDRTKSLEQEREIRV